MTFKDFIKDHKEYFELIPHVLMTTVKRKGVYEKKITLAYSTPYDNTYLTPYLGSTNVTDGINEDLEITHKTPLLLQAFEEVDSPNEGAGIFHFSVRKRKIKVGDFYDNIEEMERFLVDWLVDLVAEKIETISNCYSEEPVTKRKKNPNLVIILPLNKEDLI